MTASSRRLIDPHPVRADAAHGLAELVEIHGLDHVTAGAEGVCRPDIGVLPRRGDDHDGDSSRPLVGLEGLEHLEAAHPWHLEIDKNHLWRRCGLPAGIGAPGEQEVERFDPVLHDAQRA